MIMDPIPVNDAQASFIYKSQNGGATHFESILFCGMSCENKRRGPPLIKAIVFSLKEAILIVIPSRQSLGLMSNGSVLGQRTIIGRARVRVLQDENEQDSKRFNKEAAW